MTKIFLLALMIYGNCWAQYSLDWMEEAGNFNKINSMMTIDDSDNIITTGYMIHENIYTRKIDISGNLIWEIMDASGIQNNYQQPLWVNSDVNNDIYVVGYRYTGTSDRYINAIVVMKYDSNGGLLWKQIIPIISMINSQVQFNLRSELDDAGYLYIGTHGVDPTGFILIKLDSDGNIIFYNNNTDNAPKGFRSMRLKDGKIILTGKSANLSLAPIIAWDTSGNLLWTKGVLGRGGYDVEIDASGNSYLFTSYSNQTSGSSLEDLLIYKFDPSGTSLWTKDYDFGGQDFPIRFTLNSNRISLISIFSLSSYFNWRTLQIDLNGNLLWDTPYDGTLFNDEYPYYITANDNGEVVVTGLGGPSPDPNNLSYLQMVITNYNNSGVQQWMDLPNIYGGAGLACDWASDGSLYVISYYNMTSYHYQALPLGIADLEKSDIRVFPNPFMDNISVQTSIESYPIDIKISDISGKLVVSSSITGTQDRLNLSFLNPGSYLCLLKSRDFTKTIKLIKSL